VSEVNYPPKIIRVSKITYVFCIFVFPFCFLIHGDVFGLILVLLIILFFFSTKIIVNDDGIKLTSFGSKGLIANWNEICKVTADSSLLPGITIYSKHESPIYANQTSTIHLGFIFGQRDLCQLLEDIRGRVPTAELGTDIEVFKKKFKP